MMRCASVRELDKGELCPLLLLTSAFALERNLLSCRQGAKGQCLEDSCLILVIMQFAQDTV